MASSNNRNVLLGLVIGVVLIGVVVFYLTGGGSADAVQPAPAQAAAGASNLAAPDLDETAPARSAPGTSSAGGAARLPADNEAEQVEEDGDDAAPAVRKAQRRRQPPRRSETPAEESEEEKVDVPKQGQRREPQRPF